MKILDVPQSGSVAGVTSSRNRFGQYRRTRASPVNPNSVRQIAVRAVLASLASAWRGLTDAQRQGWTALGASIQRTDSLGQTYNLTGEEAYVSVNAEMDAAGDATVDDAPVLAEAPELLTTTLTLTDVAFSLAFTATPLAAGDRLFVYGSPQRSAGRAFESDLRLFHVSAAALASPANLLADYTARFGAPVTGKRIFLLVRVYHLGFLTTGTGISQVVA